MSGKHEKERDITGPLAVAGVAIGAAQLGVSIMQTVLASEDPKPEGKS